MELKKGINFGGYLSQCEHSLAHYETFISEADVKKAAEWGFDHIRLPIDYEVFEQDNGERRAEGVAFVDRFVDWCEAAGIDVVLDLHKAYGYDFNDANNAEKNTLFQSEPLKQRFISLWAFIARRYSCRSHVAYELLNEVVEAENAKLWNDLIARTMKEIRKYAPDTPVIYGGIQWNSAATLKYLTPPNDKNVIYTFHMYEPLIFTHQKAYWVENMPQDLDVSYPAQMSYYRDLSKLIGGQGDTVASFREEKMGKPFLRSIVQEAVDAAKAAGVRLYCGEFGVIDRAPVADTLRCFEDVMAVYGEYDIHYALWSYKEMDFGLADAHYDPIRKDMLRLLTQK